MLDKAQILEKTDLARELVEVPEWGGEVWVGELNGDDRDAWEGSLLTKPDKKGKREIVYKGARARLCAVTMQNEERERLFTDEEAIGLGQLSAKALDRVYEVALRINGLNKEDMDELVGNLEETPESESGSE